jgi:hypothetical protein
MGAPESVPRWFVRRMAPLAARSGYELLVEGAEKHGTIEWIAVREDEQLRRFVILDVWPLAPPGPNSRWQFELWVGAEVGRRYTRQLVERSGSGTLQRLAEDWLGDWFSNAVDTANSLAESQLDRSYMFPAQ